MTETYDLESTQNIPFRAFTAPVVAFDLDGTIIDSGKAVIDGVLHALSKNSLPLPESSRMREFIGPPMDDSLVSIGKVPADKLEAVKDAYREHFEAHGLADSLAYPELPGVLQALHDAGWNLAIVTSKNRINALKVLNHLGLLDYFSAVFGANSECKTKVDILRVGKESIEADGQPIVCLIGDRFYDFEAGIELDVPTVAVTWGYGNPEEYPLATVSVDDPAYLVEAITQVGASQTITV